MCAYQILGNETNLDGLCEPNEIFRSRCNWCQCDPFGTTATCTGLFCCESGTTSITDCRECICNDNYENICSDVVGCITTTNSPVSSTTN